MTANGNTSCPCEDCRAYPVATLVGYVGPVKNRTPIVLCWKCHFKRGEDVTRRSDMAVLG